MLALEDDVTDRVQQAFLNASSETVVSGHSGVFKTIPLCHWGIYFDGQSREIPVFSFLERVDELRVSRWVDKE